MNIEELRVYNLSMELGEKVWEIVNQWDYFAKDTVGKQFIKAVDSIAANISEGYGRYHYRENIHFCYYSRGSLFETKTWTDKSFRRNLINEEEHKNLISNLVFIAKLLNNYVKSIGKTNNSVDEPVIDYPKDSSEKEIKVWSNDNFLIQ